MITAALIYIGYAYTLSIALLCSGGIESQSQAIESEACAPSFAKADATRAVEQS